MPPPKSLKVPANPYKSRQLNRGRKPGAAPTKPGESAPGGFKYLKKVTEGYILTSGMVAKECGVAARTISKWCDLNYLPHYRIPGSNDRRIYAHVLLKFMRDNNMSPSPSFLALLEGKLQLVAVGLPPHLGVKVLDSQAGVTRAVGYNNLFDLATHLADPTCRGVVVVGSELTCSEVSLVAARVAGRFVVVRVRADDQAETSGVADFTEQNIEQAVTHVNTLLQE